jgi:phenylpropionate dioxygenase-like ring-hydroxylating dioxygenase large terminal subunit
MNKISIAKFDALKDRKPAYALVGEVDLVVVRHDDQVSVFYGRCLHRGALMADGYVDGENLICGVHYWDYRLSVELMKILARACGHHHLNQLDLNDLVTWKEDMSRLSGVAYGGVGALH